MDIYVPKKNQSIFFGNYLLNIEIAFHSHTQAREYLIQMFKSKNNSHRLALNGNDLSFTTLNFSLSHMFLRLQREMVERKFISISIIVFSSKKQLEKSGIIKM